MIFCIVLSLILLININAYNHQSRSLKSIRQASILQKSSSLTISQSRYVNNRQYEICMISDNRNALKVIIAGAPAAGKGTQCEIIKEKFGLVHLSTGDILRDAVKQGTALGGKAKEYMDAGKLVPDELIIDVVCARLKYDDCQKNGWLLDGFPRTKLQADALTKSGMIPDCFLLLDTPENVLVDRVTGRRTDPVTGKIYHLKYSPPENDEVASRLIQRSDDTEEKVKLRFKDFQTHIDSIQSSYKGKTITIDGSDSKSKISNTIVTCLENVQSEKESIASKSREAINFLLKEPKALTVFGMGFLIIMDKYLKKLFLSKGWAFPSSLAGMVAIFTTLSGLHSVAPISADNIARFFGPAVAFIKAWLPFFFVPPLVVLPLKMSLLRGMEIKLLSLIVVGVFASLASAGILSQALTSIFPNINKTLYAEEIKPSPIPALPTIALPAVMSTIFLTGSKFFPSQIIFQRGFSMASTILGFLLGNKVSPLVRKVINPVLTCASFAIILSSVLAAVTGQSWSNVLLGYYGSGKGAGDLISSLLGPSILSFGLQSYYYRSTLANNAPRMALSTFLSAIFGLGSSAVMAKMLKIAPVSIALSTLTRCITSPLALAGAGLTGADPSLAALAVVITGLIGASFGEAFLNKIGVTEDMSIGISIGASSHGLGTATLAKEPIKFASAVVSMSLTGLWTVALLAIPQIRNSIIKIV